MIESHSSSVYFLINDLCENLLHNYNPHQPVNCADVRKLRSSCYEILLKKSNEYSNFTEAEAESSFDPLKELDIILFTSKIKAKNDYKKLKNCEQLEELLESVSNNRYFTEETGNDVLSFLMHSKRYFSEYNTIEDDEKTSLLLVPGPFTLHSEYSQSSCYPNKQIKYRHGKPEHFKGLRAVMDYHNPYLPRYIFETGNRNELNLDPKPFKLCSKMNTKSPALKPKFLEPVTTVFNLKSIEDKICNESMKSSSHLKFQLKIKDKTERFGWNWENLGKSNIAVENGFASDLAASLPLQYVMEESMNKCLEARIVPMNIFLTDLRSLVVGIESDSFKPDEQCIFYMAENLTIPDVSPNTIQNYMTDFLECGTYYKRLQIMIMKKNFRLMFDGFIFKALCGSIEDYLRMFRQFVFAEDDKTLLGFYQRMKKVMKQISALSYTLLIAPDVDPNLTLPLGSQFLGYLYKEIMRITQNDLIILLIYILKRCCHVYFKHLQKWIFYGHLDDISNELFICFVDHYHPNTKYHYDKAYFIRKEFVPGFFQGFEDQILQCGKYTMLLKAFKPNHPLFNIDYPSISVCLSFDEIATMENECKEYYKKALDICEKPITVGEIYKAKAEIQNDFLKLASEKSKKNFEKWNVEKTRTAVENAAEKKKRLDEITDQLKERKDRKIIEKQENIALERKLLKEYQEQEDKLIQLDNERVQKNIEYYKDLNSLIMKRKNKIDNEILRLHIPQNTDHICAKLTPPISTAGSEFESCYGDEDVDSIYDECMSPVLSPNLIVNYNNELTEEITKENQYQNVDDEVNANLDEELESRQRASDLINSNEIYSTDTSSRNRKKNLGSNLYGCFDSETNLKVKTFSNKNQLTEAQKNKLKVLSHEFGYDNYIKNQDLNSNDLQSTIEISISTPELSELQKNRIKMMQNDTFAAFNNDFQRKNLNLELNTERSRNRRKVLESEFNILTGSCSVPQLTPMSTTSDTPLTDEDRTERTINDDIKNANLNNSCNISNIDIDAMQLNITTADIIETPVDALNTAGVLAKYGFEFNAKNQSNEKSDTIENVDLNTSERKNNNIDYQDPYKRCEELILNNFKCKPMHDYFQLKEFSNQSKPIDKEKLNQLVTNQKNLNSLSVITLTEFLQKSIIYPLQAHLEIMNNEIMRVFLIDLDIIQHFNSLRNYFLLMDGEFGSIICDELISKLEKGAAPNELLNYQMLHSILDSAVGSSIKGSDKNVDNLSFIVNDIPEKFDLSSPSVLSNLSLSYRVIWPLNLILNPETLEQYGNIFKYLIKVRRISWIMEQSFQILKENAKKYGKELLLSPQYRRVQQIRHKFFHFVYALKNHITSSALQGSWKQFEDDIVTAKNIEDIYRKHTTYIKKILFLCMLNRRSIEFYNTIENIFKVTLRFYRNLKAREWKKKPGNEYFTHSRYEKLIGDEAEFDKFIKYVIYLGNKIVKRGYQEEIGEFISLINFNHYYVAEN